MNNHMIKLFLLPNSPQKKRFAQCAGAYRWIYNKALEERKQIWKMEKRHLSFYDQARSLSLLKEQEDMQWLKDMHSQMLKQALFELDKNFESYNIQVTNENKLAYPPFRAKGKNESFCYPIALTIDKDRINFPKIGWIHFSHNENVEAIFKNTTVIQEGNQWYAYIANKHTETDWNPIAL